MLDAEPLEDGRREHAARERAPEDVLELRVEAADAQRLEGEGAALEQLVGREALLARHLDRRLACARVHVCVCCVSIGLLGAPKPEQAAPSARPDTHVQKRMSELDTKSNFDRARLRL